MASTGSTLSLTREYSHAHRTSPPACTKSKSKISSAMLPSRRQSLFMLTVSTAVTAVEMSAMAKDIPLFGIRKKLEKVEEEVEEIFKEGTETAEKGIEAAGKEIETAAAAVSFGGSNLTQAGVVVGAEVLGILVATSVVNGILGPEAQNS